jgi:DNA end-binding protein Ku
LHDRAGRTIIDKMTDEFEPEKFEDRYENAMIELIRSKQAGLPAPKEKPAPRAANVVNLMEALRRSSAAKRLRRANPVTGQRRSLHKIAEELADDGHLNERGRPYNAISISRILKG